MIREAPKNFFMTSSSDSVPDRFFHPVQGLLQECRHSRKCPTLSDIDWIKLGVSRVVDAPASGRGFLQSLIGQGQLAPSYSHFFETLKSTRRLKLCEEVNEGLIATHRHLPEDALAGFDELKNFEVRAGDGHWHSPACHDAPRFSSLKDDGTEVKKKYPVGHLYTLDLRTHLMRHLMTSDQVNRRKEHDMRGLKRAGASGLRDGVAKGRKLLMVWDSAAIDFGYWQKLKQGHGIYFLCRDKEVEKIQCGNRPWDREAPVNDGVVADRQVGSSANSGYLVRVIEFQDPATRRKHRFVTNEMTLPPGLLAHLYRMRWDIEKVFDEVKNRLNQKKAWASSETAKSMQGHFIALTHNLMILLNRHLEQEGVQDLKEQKRRKKRREKEGKNRRDRKFVEGLSIWLRRATQRGVKFIRWLRVQLRTPTSWSQACASLTTLYSHL